MPITFSCACGKTFTVPDAMAGKTGKCNQCGQSLAVPVPAPAPAAPADDGLLAIVDDTPPPPSMLPPRPAPVAAAPLPAASRTAPNRRAAVDDSGFDRKLVGATVAGAVVAAVLGGLLSWGADWYGLALWGVGSLIALVMTKVTPERSVRVGLIAAGLTVAGICFSQAIRSSLYPRGGDRGFLGGGWVGGDYDGDDYSYDESDLIDYAAMPDDEVGIYFERKGLDGAMVLARQAGRFSPELADWHKNRKKIAAGLDKQGNFGEAFKVRMTPPTEALLEEYRRLQREILAEMSTKLGNPAAMRAHLIAVQDAEIAEATDETADTASAFAKPAPAAPPSAFGRFVASFHWYICLFSALAVVTAYWSGLKGD